MNYEDFIAGKKQSDQWHGFDVIDMPDSLFPFQRDLVEWSLKKGRAALLCDCGLGKTAMQLAWADNVAKHTDKPVLILAPLAVGTQTVREGDKFGIEVTHRREGIKKGDRIVVTNYERLQYYKPDDYGGVVCDESSILKNFAGKRRAEITEFMRTVKYRLLCTATAAPNDYDELGNSSEALGHLGYSDMLAMFFKQDTAKDYLGWARSKYIFRGHAQEPFFRWVCSWARVCRRPSDLGHSDDNFALPELIETEEALNGSTPREGMLFSTPARSLQEQREERRNTIGERCERAASLAESHGGASVIWCHLNDEGKAITRMLDNSVEVSGALSDEEKESRLLAFARGDIQRLVIKPKIGSFGLNWQHCHNVVTFASHSWEQYYQSVRRCWRFGQENPVKVTIVATDGESGILSNLRRKADQADHMFESLSYHANDALKIDRSVNHETETESIPWL